MIHIERTTSEGLERTIYTFALTHYTHENKPDTMALALRMTVYLRRETRRHRFVPVAFNNSSAPADVIAEALDTVRKNIYWEA